MWETSEIKERGRTVLRMNYWKCVLVSFIMGFVLSGSSSFSTNQISNNEQVRQAFQQLRDAMNNMEPAERIAVIAAISSVITLAIVVGFLIKIFIYNPLHVGGLAFFKKNVMDPPAELNEIGEGFKNYLHIFVTLFLTDLFLTLWTLLFIVPGIIKSYSYRMVPYILADEPDLSPTETITRSREMMDGNKWHAFCYDISFIGWWLLTILTCGLVGMFWFGPYKNNSDAALYLAIRGDMEPDYGANVPPVYPAPAEPEGPENAAPVYPAPAEPVNTEAAPQAPAEPVNTEAVPQAPAEAVPEAAPETIAETAPESAPESVPQETPEDAQQTDDQ